MLVGNEIFEMKVTGTPKANPDGGLI